MTRIQILARLAQEGFEVSPGSERPAHRIGLLWPVGGGKRAYLMETGEFRDRHYRFVPFHKIEPGDGHREAAKRLRDLTIEMDPEDPE